MFIKTCKRKSSNGSVYETHYLTEGYRDKKTGKVKHKHLLNLSKLPKDLVFILKEAIKSNGSIDKVKLKDLTMLSSKEYGSILVFEKLFNRYFKNLFNRKYQTALKAIIINKIFDPKSKNALINWLRLVDFDYKDQNKNNLYRALDYLSKKQDLIERKLYQHRNTKECNLYLYDITSTYFTGKGAENICKHGYSRDHRPDKLQVNIGLVTDDTGVPITVEVIEGNLTDKQSLKNKIDILKERFNLSKISFVFDRGMKTKANLNYLQQEGFSYITALPKAELKKKARENKKIRVSLLDKRNLMEFIEEETNTRYILSHNEEKAYADRSNRLHLIAKTELELQKVQNLKRSYTDKQIQDKVSKKINRYKCEKYFIYSIKGGKLEFTRNTNRIKDDEQYDGFYMLESTNIQRTTENIEKTYKSLQLVERVFDEVKNRIEIRPVFHFKEPRIKGHIFSCFLAYYLLHAFRQNTKELLTKYSLDTLLTELRDIKKSYFKLNCFAFEKISQLTDLQKQILKANNISVVTNM